MKCLTSCNLLFGKFVSFCTLYWCLRMIDSALFILAKGQCEVSFAIRSVKHGCPFKLLGLFFRFIHWCHSFPYSRCILMCIFQNCHDFADVPSTSKSSKPPGIPHRQEQALCSRFSPAAEAKSWMKWRHMHCFPVVGDGHQPNSRVLYTHYKDSLFLVGWVYPQRRELIDPHMKGDQWFLLLCTCEAGILRLRQTCLLQHDKFAPTHLVFFRGEVDMSILVKIPYHQV